jgi:ATP-binding cassette subfamily C protein
MSGRFQARARRSLDLLGHDVASVLALSVGAGLGLFGAELALAFAIQTFLHALGFAAPVALTVPIWLRRDDLGFALSFLFAVATVRGLLQWAQSYLQGAALERFRYIQRRRLLRWTFLSRAPSTSQVTSLFTERTTSAGRLVMHIQSFILYSTVAAFIYLSLLALEWRLTALSTLMILVLGLPFRLLSRRINAAGEAHARDWEDTNARLILAIRNLLFLRIYGLHLREERSAQSSLRAFLTHVLTDYRMSGFLNASPQIFGVAFICGITVAAKGPFGMPAGAIVSYFYLFLRLLQNLSMISVSASVILFERTHFLALSAWWDSAREQEGQMRQESDRGLTHAEPFAGPLAWRCRGLAFRYPQADRPVIQGLDLDIAAGSALVVTGASGAGKSTLLELLIGELTPTAGVISVVEGHRAHPMADARDRLLASLGYVGPESFLIEGTVRENLVYGQRRDPTEAEIQAAVDAAECQFIRSLPRGLDHPLTEQGKGLSAGQKQRLALARALLRQPKALILDEATANLDSDTERRLVDTLIALKGRMTLVVVTHRPELLRLADRLLQLASPAGNPLAGQGPSH